MTGIFSDVREARLVTSGVAEAEWCRVSTQAEADAYLSAAEESFEEQALAGAEGRNTVKTLIGYTDGSATAAPKAAGWGFLALRSAPAEGGAQETLLTERHGAVNVAHPDQADHMGATALTNNTAEMTAIGQALQWCTDAVDRQDVEEVHICTDSQVCIRSLRSGRKPRKNRRLVTHVRQLAATLSAKRPVRLLWVRGHQRASTAAARWNARADELAARGRLQSTEDHRPQVSPRLPFLQRNVNETVGRLSGYKRMRGDVEEEKEGRLVRVRELGVRR